MAYSWNVKLPCLRTELCEMDICKALELHIAKCSLTNIFIHLGRKPLEFHNTPYCWKKLNKIKSISSLQIRKRVRPKTPVYHSKLKICSFLFFLLYQVILILKKVYNWLSEANIIVLSRLAVRHFVCMFVRLFSTQFRAHLRTYF